MLKQYLTNLANAFRAKLGTTDPINAQDFTNKIDEVYDEARSIITEITDWSYFFNTSARTGMIEKMKYADTSKGTNFSYMFNNCTNLTSIPQLNTSKGTNFVYMFSNCRLLENVTFTGSFKIKTNLSIFNTCPNLTVESLMSFINALENVGTSTYKITIGSTNLAKLTTEQIAIATNKNLTLA